MIQLATTATGLPEHIVASPADGDFQCSALSVNVLIHVACCSSNLVESSVSSIGFVSFGSYVDISRTRGYIRGVNSFKINNHHTKCNDHCCSCEFRARNPIIFMPVSFLLNFAITVKFSCLRC